MDIHNCKTGTFRKVVVWQYFVISLCGAHLASEHAAFIYDHTVS